MINAKGEAPTSLAPFTQTCFAHGVFLAGARMTYHLDPLRAVAAWHQGFGVPVYGGINQWSEPLADIAPELNATGAGARPDMDGVDGAGAYFATMSDCSDAETIESDRPFLYLIRNYFKSSYGHGKFRGGAGVGFSFMIHHVPWLAMGAFGYGTKFPSTLGIFGGYAAPTTFIRTVQGSNVKALLGEGRARIPHTLDEVYEAGNPEQGQEALHHICMSVRPLMNGDTFTFLVGGGAGYGDALERDPEAVLKDLRDGLTTHWAARNVYRVVYDENTLRLDAEGTERSREDARAQRLRRAKPYEVFEKEWRRLRPPDPVIRSYGPYPHPSRPSSHAAAEK